MSCCFTSSPMEEPLETDQPPQQSQIHDDEISGDKVWPFTEFFFSDLQTATKNFSFDEIVSENGYESSNIVYKGQFQNVGFVAVKKFKNTAWPDPDLFAEKAQRVGDLKHKRFVNLMGYCCDVDERLLVSEFLPNDSLAKRLFNQESQTMEWSMRLRVAYCVAEALDYCSTSGFASYSNLSAYTVLFDEDGDACLSCFGLMKETNYDQRTTGSVNSESVTYRFGTILVNLLTGKQIPSSHAPEMINGKSAIELMDPNLDGKFSTKEATVVFELASVCLEYQGSFNTKHLVTTLKPLQTKTQVPSNEMTKDKEEASPSNQQQQIEESLKTNTEDPSFELPVMTEKYVEYAPSSSQQGQLEPLQTIPEDGSSSSTHHLSPIAEACSRMDLNAIHEILVKAKYEDDKQVLEYSLDEWLPEMSLVDSVGEIADKAFEDKDFEYAIQCYSKVIEARRLVFPSVYARRGLSYLFRKKPKDAHTDVMKAQEVYPEWPTGYYLESVVLAKLGRRTGSDDVFKQATLLTKETEHYC